MSVLNEKMDDLDNLVYEQDPIKEQNELEIALKRLDCIEPDSTVAVVPNANHMHPGKCATPALPVIEAYKFFSSCHADYEQIEDQDLHYKLMQAVRQCEEFGSYTENRLAICGINMEMNRRQFFAPRLRPQLPRTMKMDELKAVSALDQQVIDLHWCAHSYDLKPQKLSEKAQKIFVEPFNFDAASEFARLEARMDVKLADLNLSERLQWECSVLQSKAIRKKWRTLCNGDVRGSHINALGLPQIEQRLIDALIRSGRRQDLPHLKNWLDVWLAQKIVGTNAVEICLFLARLRGVKATDPRVVRRILDTLEHHLDG